MPLDVRPMRVLLLQATVIAALVVPIELLQAVSPNSCATLLTLPLAVAGLAVAGQCWWLGRCAGHIPRSLVRSVLWWIGAIALSYTLLDQWTVYTVVPDYSYNVTGSIQRSRSAWPPPTSGQYWDAVRPLCLVQTIVGAAQVVLFWLVVRELWRMLRPFTPFASQRRWRFLAIVCAAMLLAASTARFWFSLRMFTVDWLKLDLQAIMIPLRVVSALAACTAAWVAVECALLRRARSTECEPHCCMCGYPAVSLRGDLCPECGASLAPPVHPAA